MSIANEVMHFLNQLPTPPGQPIPPGTNAEQLRIFEEEHSTPIPETMKDWLKLCNGPNVPPGGYFGIKTGINFLNIDYYWKMHPEWKEKKWIPISGDGCGNYFTICPNRAVKNDCPVFFIDIISSAEIPSYIVSSNLWIFLKESMKKEIVKSRWPFQKDITLQLDPGLVEYRSENLPWIGSTQPLG